MTTFEQKQVKITWRLVNRMERREALATRVAIEKQHAREHRLLSVHCAQRALSQHEVELRNAQRDLLQRKHDDFLTQPLGLAINYARLSALAY